MRDKGAKHPHKLQQLLQQLDTMPEPPRAAIQAVSMLEDPEVSVGRIAEYISMDECMTSKLLKLSNMAHYGSSRRVATVKDALIRMGTNTVRCALYSSMLEMAGFKPNFFFIELWKSALFTAFVAKDMGLRLAHPRPDLCFTAGLLCDVGQLIFNEFASDIYGNLVQEVLKGSLDLIEAENQVFGFTHVQLGYKMADLWKLPPMYRNTIRYHHQPMDAYGKVRPDEFKLVVAVHVANSLSPLFADPAGDSISLTAINKAGLHLPLDMIIRGLSQRFDLYFRDISRMTDSMFGEGLKT